MARFKSYAKSDGSSMTISFKEAKYKRTAKLYKKVLIASAALNLVLLGLLINNLL